MDPYEYLQAFVQAMINDLSLIGIEVVLYDVCVQEQMKILLPIWLENWSRVKIAKITKNRGP